jgi:ubiquinol-cytochrome c reductase iron-sulfur subunit
MSTTEERAGFDVDDPELTRFDLVREGARRDGVEIVHYAPRFPVPGTRAERRVERAVASLFLLAGGAAVAFLAVLIWTPWEYERGANMSKLYTPLLGLTLGLMLAGLGFGVIVWAKKLLPAEVAVEKRHVGGSAADERRITGASLAILGDETGVSRRPLLKGALALGLAPVGAAAAAPLIAGLLKDPHNPDVLFHTGFDPANNDGQPVRLVREDGSPVRPEDVSVGGQITVFPGIPEGATNKWADSPTLLIHLRDADAAQARANLAKLEVNAPPEDDPDGGMWNNFVAYSKICTHLGCPASLFEKETNRLLCPCHQSQFLITDNAKPIFGPATRHLPLLPIDVDDEGFFYATSDYRVPIGPGFWERP